MSLGTAAASECQGATFTRFFCWRLRERPVSTLVLESRRSRPGCGRRCRVSVRGAGRLRRARLGPDAVCTAGLERCSAPHDIDAGDGRLRSHVELGGRVLARRRGTSLVPSPSRRWPPPRSSRVRVRARGGVTSDASAYAWTVAVGAARPRSLLHPLLTTAPVRPWISRNATFEWLLQRSATAECRLDGDIWKPCANPKTYLGLRLGTHVFRVRARSANGSRSGVNRFAWTVVSGAAGRSHDPVEPCRGYDLDRSGLLVRHCGR